MMGLTESVCCVYLDDLSIPSETFEEHLEGVRLVLDRLMEANLALNAPKCKFGVSSVEFLGHVCDAKGLHPKQDKIEKIQQWPAPHTPKQVRAFIGLANYYRKFVPRFAKIAAPLMDLLRKELRFLWLPIHQIAFEEIKAALIHTVTLARPVFQDPDRPFYLFADA